MKYFFTLLILTGLVSAENNTTQEHNRSKKTQLHKQKKEDNRTASMEEKIRRQMEKEQKYAKEQKFYQADQYDFKGAEVDPDTLKKVKAIEPDYDFDITDVYRDDI